MIADTTVVIAPGAPTTMETAASTAASRRGGIGEAGAAGDHAAAEQSRNTTSKS